VGARLVRLEYRDVLSQRRSVRAYRDEPVPFDVLRRITDGAVVRAPSAGFSQGLRLVVVTDPATRHAIAVAAAEDELAEHGRPRWKAAAPVHVVVLVREGDYHERYQRPDKLAITGGQEVEWPAPYWYVDAGAALVLLLLGAIDEGLAAAVFGVMDVPALRAAVRFPENLSFVAVVTMGYAAPPDQDAARRASSVFSQRRKLRAEVVHWERWGGGAP
jgi:FMN reductase [NAD(P)H]